LSQASPHIFQLAGWILISICLSLIAREDFQRREIRISWFIFLLILEIVLLATDFQDHMTYHLLLNGLMMVILVGGTYFIFKLRNKGIFFDHYFGWGDVVMLVCLGFAMSASTFVAFFVGSTWLVLLVVVGLHLLNQIDLSTFSIPLAGIWAVGFLLLLVVDKTDLLSIEWGLLW